MEHKEQQHILFTTQKLVREELSMKYVQEIFKELTDEVVKYLRLPKPKSITQEEDRIRDSREKRLSGVKMNFIVTDPQGNFIGICGVEGLKTKIPELGLRIKQSARGKGYGKEMIATLIKRVREHGDFDYLLYRAHRDNVATRKIAERFGGELQRDEQGNEKIFTEWKFDKSSSFPAVEYRIYNK